MAADKKENSNSLESHLPGGVDNALHIVSHLFEDETMASNSNADLRELHESLSSLLENKDISKILQSPTDHFKTLLEKIHLTIFPQLSDEEFARDQLKLLEKLEVKLNMLVNSGDFEDFKQLVESSLDIIFRISVQGKIIYISPSVEDSLGYSVHEVIGKEITKFIREEDAERFRYAMSEFFSNKILIGFRSTIIHKNGQNIPVEIEARFELN